MRCKPLKTHDRRNKMPNWLKNSCDGLIDICMFDSMNESEKGEKKRKKKTISHEYRCKIQQESKKARKQRVKMQSFREEI